VETWNPTEKGYANLSHTGLVKKLSPLLQSLVACLEVVARKSEKRKSGGRESKRQQQPSIIERV